MSSYKVNLPFFLESYVEFMQHVEGLYASLSNTAKGAEFAKLSKDILSTQEELLRLKPKLNSKQTHDEGVDIFWIDSDINIERAYCQSKLHIRGKDDLDVIIGKFASFEKSKFIDNQEPKQGNIFEWQENLNNDGKFSKLDTDTTPNVKYYITTISSIKNILNLYVKSARPSVDFYQSLVASKRIEIVDGEPLYKLFLEAYRKEYAIPQQVEFRIHDKFVNYKNVYVGIISAEDLIKIYSNCGKGIFFENVRDFLGLDARNSALDINNEIFKVTVQGGYRRSK